MSNYILAIGIDNYSECNKLNNAVRDITNIVDLLTSEYEFDKANATVLLNEDATLENIVDNLEALLPQQEAGDNLLILFAGHGEFDESLQVGYLMPVEARPYSKSTYFSYSTLFDYIKALKSHHILLISDSCYSGSIFIPSRAVETSKEKLDKIPSKWAITSGRIEPVSDGKPGENSPFTESLINNLKTNKELLLSTSELSNKIVSEVAEKGAQIPRGEPLQAYGHKGGEFIFRRRSAASVKDQPVTQVESESIRTETIDLIRANYELEEKIEAAENENKLGTTKRLLQEKTSLSNILKNELRKELEIRKNDLLRSGSQFLPSGYIELHNELQTVRDEKNRIVKQQKYAEAAALRDEEKAIERKLNELIDIESLATTLKLTKDSIFIDYYSIQLIFDYSPGKNSFEKRSFIEELFSNLLFLDLSFANGFISQYIYKDERGKIINELKKYLE